MCTTASAGSITVCNLSMLRGFYFSEQRTGVIDWYSAIAGVEGVQGGSSAWWNLITVGQRSPFAVAGEHESARQSGFDCCQQGRRTEHALSDESTGYLQKATNLSGIGAASNSVAIATVFISHRT